MPEGGKAALSLLLVFAVASAGLAALMQHSETTIAIPQPGEATPLNGLQYKSRRFEASISSVTLRVDSAEGADPVTGAWTFTAANTDGQLHRVEIQVRLLDETGKQLGWSVGKHSVRAGANGETFTVPMKVKANVWRAAKKARIFADWQS